MPLLLLIFSSRIYSRKEDIIIISVFNIMRNKHLLHVKHMYNARYVFSLVFRPEDYMISETAVADETMSTVS